MLTALHVTAVCLTGALVLYADEQALMWVLGKKRLMDERTVRFLHYAIALGLGVTIITGGFLFFRATNFYLHQTAFIVKMIAVGALIINTYFIDRFSSVALTHPYVTLSRPDRVPLFISGAVSVLGWIAAVIGGLLIG